MTPLRLFALGWRWHRPLLRALLALALLPLLAPPAWGHAALVQASPAPGSVLQQAPDAVLLTFSEPVSVTHVGLLGPDGRALAASAQGDGASVRVAVPPQVARGTYLLSWRIVSADGHPVGGTLDYAIGSASAHRTAAASDRGRGAAIWLARWLTWLALFAAVGAGLFRTMAPRACAAWARPAVAAGALLLCVDWGLQGLDLLDAPAAALFTPAPWRAALGSTYALTLGGLALALVAAWRAMQARGGVPQRAWAGAALGLAAVAASLSGHAGTAPPPWLARPLVAVHVALALAWFGCLVPLARHLRAGLDGRADAGVALARFSGWIAPAVGLLLLSGVGLAALQLGGPSDLWRTAYGRVLLAKLALVAGLLGLAAVNRWRHTQPALAGEPAATRRLVRAIQVEVLLAIALLAVVSLWRLTPPPRSLAAAAPTQPQVLELHGRHLQARLAQDHEGVWRIDLRDARGQPLAAQQVRLALASPEHGVEPLWIDAQQDAIGHWRARLPVLPLASTQLQLQVLIDDFTQETLRGAPGHPMPGIAPTSPATGSGHGHAAHPP